MRVIRGEAYRNKVLTLYPHAINMLESLEDITMQQLLPSAVISEHVGNSLPEPYKPFDCFYEDSTMKMFLPRFLYTYATTKALRIRSTRITKAQLKILEKAIESPQTIPFTVIKRTAQALPRTAADLLVTLLLTRMLS